MPVKYPTMEEIKQAFDNAIPSGQPFDQQRWDRLFRAEMNPTWQPMSDGIEVLQANGARLVRVHWEFAIDKMDTSSESDLRSNAGALHQQLLALINGEQASFNMPWSDTKEGVATVVQCWTQGIIG